MKKSTLVIEYTNDGEMNTEPFSYYMEHTFMNLTCVHEYSYNVKTDGNGNGRVELFGVDLIKFTEQFIEECHADDDIIGIKKGAFRELIACSYKEEQKFVLCSAFWTIWNIVGFETYTFTVE